MADQRERDLTTTGGVNPAHPAEVVDGDRQPVDLIAHPADHSPVARADLTPVERRLLSDLFAIVEEHADEAALPMGVRVMANLAVDYLSKGPK